MSMSCPCGSGDDLENCCAPIIGTRSAMTAEQLMRSRYTAYVQGDTAYLLATWHRASRPREMALDPGQRWLGLRVKRTEGGRVGDSTGIVEFVARFKIDGRGHRLHEVSRFVLEDGKWYYVDDVLAGS